MKRAIIVAALLAMASPVMAGQWNWGIFGSNDHHRKGHSIEKRDPQPGPPTVDVPEPASIILLGTGILALVIGGAVEGKRHDTGRN